MCERNTEIDLAAASKGQFARVQCEREVTVVTERAFHSVRGATDDIDGAGKAGHDNGVWKTK